ncbi:MAG: V-type ATP synthase subunit E [Eubacterium sp.]|nr:V-type ATP synthase subunit E [Eubacterium sp.]
MAGIEKITKEILADGEKEVSRIIAEAEKSAERQKSDKEKECKSFLDTANDRLEKKIAGERKKIDSQCEQIEKLTLLKTKQQIIEEILQKAKDKILDDNTDEYFGTLIKLLEGQLRPEDGIMYLNDKDLARVTSEFKNEAIDLARKAGGSISFSDNPISINGGFLLKYGNIEINSSLDAVFDERKDELMDIVNKVLFA